MTNPNETRCEYRDPFYGRCLKDAEHETRRCYCDSDGTATTTIGLLELAKLDVIARTDTGLPLRYDDLEG